MKTEHDEPRQVEDFYKSRPIDLKLEDISILEWHPTQNPDDSAPEQVHLVFNISPPLVVRFKSADTIGELIEALSKHRRQVWRDADPLVELIP